MSDKKKITITVSSDLYDKLEEMSQGMGMTKNSLCTYFVGQFVYNTSKLIDGTLDILNNASVSTLPNAIEDKEK